jgi:hypothetical protein
MGQPEIMDSWSMPSLWPTGDTERKRAAACHPLGLDGSSEALAHRGSPGEGQCFEIESFFQRMGKDH